MTDELSVLERAWAVLEAPRGRELSSYPVDVAFGGLPCRVALDSAGTRHVLIPVDSEPLQPDSRPSVLGLTIRRLAFGNEESNYVDLSCAEQDLFAEFDDVVADVLEAAQEAERPGSAAVRAVGRWRRLFRSRLVRGLSHQAKLGLFAELTMLSALLDTEPTLPVDLWRGPLREPHDFETPRACLEIKALGLDTDTVTIHGLAQLDTHDDKPLELVLVAVVEDPDGTTLAELVSRLRDRVHSRAELRSRLNAAGWSDNTGAEDSEAFIAGEVRRIAITDDVPRLAASSLVAGALPNGVDELSYAVDVAALLPHATAASFREIAEGACL